LARDLVARKNRIMYIMLSRRRRLQPFQGSWQPEAMARRPPSDPPLADRSAADRRPADRFVIAATVDRLIYGDDNSFGADDARLLLDALPHKPSPWIQLGVAGKMSGGSSRGFAAGVGDVQVKDEKDRQFQYATGADAYTRAGQWKLMWIGKRTRQYVEIEQVMADATDDGRGALVS
jgi:hypothetical protein